MKSIKISRLLAGLVIVAILTACPPADKGGGSKGDSVTGPTFKNLGINLAEQKIIVFFSTDISGTPDASKISLKKGSNTLKPTTDYTLAIEKGTLVITLKVALKTGDKYTVELQGGAVKGANGKSNTANAESRNKTLTVGIIPAITPDSLAFKPNSNTVLTLAFNTDIEIVAPAKIRVEVQTGGTGKFTETRASSMVDIKNKTLLNLTLGTAAAHNNIYRVTVGAGALRATESNLANTAELTSNKFTYSTSPILDSANRPYILDNKLVAPFNLPIALKNRAMVKVYKNPDGDNQVITLQQGDIAVNNRNFLEITLPAVKANEVYRLRLEAGAVNEEGKAANANKIITPKDRDITIGAAPSLHAETEPFLGRQKIIATFTAPIRILNRAGIKYQLNGTLTTPNTEPKVINANQLEIPLNAPLANAQVYRIHLEAGALGGGKNQPSTGSIQPEDKDITAVGPTLTNVKPAFDSATQLSVTFLVDVAIVGDGSTIKVQKKDDGGRFTTLTLASRDIAVDGTEAKKINITLTGGEKITPYTQVWKVEFPENTIKTRTDIPNAGPLTTLESEKPRLTDLYRWEEVKAEGSKWKARYAHTSVVFAPDGEGERIWVLGGSDGTNRLNDVWSSPDGETWTQVDADAGWTARYGHTSVVFDRKIWVLGGNDSTSRLNDVWSSTDGSTWTESTPPSNARKITSGTGKNWWPIRYAHTSVVFDPDGAGKRIWVMGGFSPGIDTFNDVWSSADGETWTQVDAAADWKARSFHTSVVFDPAGAGKRIWVMGGRDVAFDSLNDVWSSDNGQTWGKGTGLTHPVSSARAVEYDGRLWSLGGGHKKITG